MALNDISDIEPFDIFEVSFKDGARKEFCKNINKLDLTTGDYVVVDSGNGYDIGKISLSGDLVRLQMRKRKVTDCQELNKIVRFASEYDINKLHEARNMEYDTMVRARAIAASLDLDMKIGDVEYQADKRKATFFYTSDGRVDFRELVKLYAKEFKVKIEMRQIGIRQESSKIGGIGSCGRELCCSTWHTNFTSVTTEMVRYQNLSVNQTKLTGLCGRLKCCLNYELDTYLEALKDFPKKADSLKLKYNMAYLVKMDIFKGIMYYSIKDENDRIKIYAVPKERVFEIKEMNEKNQFPEDLGAILYLNEDTGDDMDFEDVTGQIELPEEKRKKRNKRKFVKRRKPNKNSDKELNKNDDNQNNSSNSDKSNKRRRFNKNKRNKKD
ncbi:MAG TPA: hypothetical protein ENK91_04915 [Bacteroidetes bacterium]|nr:hypothetical protein [Bacteroidota bacterium]